MAERLKDLFERVSEGERREPQVLRRGVIIGLDFGTSGTKVAFRDWGPQVGGRDLYLIDFGTDSLMGFPRFAVPSSLAVEDGRIYFGTEAEERSRFGCATMRSLKTALLDPQVMGSLPSLGPGSGDGFGSEQDAPKLGNNAEFLTTLFLAHVLNRSWGAVREVYPDITDRATAVNLDVPVDNLQGAPERDLFKGICAHSFLMKDEVHQGMSRVDALDLWHSVCTSPKASRLRKKGSNTQVVAEGQALIQGVGAAQDWSAGTNYVTIDLGAGTTDVGVFRLHQFRKKGRLGFTRRIPFYSAMTALVGCDSIDRALFDGMGAQEEAFERLKGAVRAAKSALCVEAGQEAVEITGGWELKREDLVDAVLPTAKRSFEHYGTAFGQAYKKDRNQCFWEELKVFVMGGGSLIPEFKRRFREPPRPIVKRVDLSDLVELDGAVVTGASSQEPLPHEIPFVVVANGLTFSPASMPELVTPDGVNEHGNIEKKLGEQYDWDWEDGYSK